MKRRSFAVIKIVILSVLASTVAFGQTPRVSDRQVTDLLNRIDREIATLRTERSRQGNFGTVRRDETNGINSLESAVTRMRSSVSFRRNATTELDAVLAQAASVDTLMTRNTFANEQAAWGRIRADIDTLAGYYNTTARWTGSGGVNPVDDRSRFGYYTTDAQMRTLVGRLRSDAALFRSSYNRWSRSNWRGIFTGNNAQINQRVTELDQAINRLSRDYATMSYRSDDVNQLLMTAAEINRFFRDTRTNNDVTTRWNQLRTDLDALAANYRVAWNWDNPVIGTPTDTFGGFDARITGTYRLNRTLSDNVSDAVNRAVTTRTYGSAQTERMRRNLERRLQSPEMLAIEKRGQQITLASSNAPAVELVADSVGRTETNPNGRSVTTRVDAAGRDVTINYEGDRMNDFYVSFTPAGRDQLRVTRRVYLENRNEQVTVTSVYDRTSQTAQFDTVYTRPRDNTTATGVWAVPNNTSLIATLNTPLSTRTAREGDRFTMTVNSPAEYSGAVIEGRVVDRERSGVITGRANMSLAFDNIRLRDGRTYQFAGLVEQVRQPDGDVVSVNNEGQIRDNNQTTQTVTRAGIGAVLGALIGAIAGGGEGAAIGAGVGAGAGAGSVVLQGRNNLELATGSQFSITATAPLNVARRP